jgi:hypothetical protein
MFLHNHCYILRRGDKDQEMHLPRRCLDVIRERFGVTGHFTIMIAFMLLLLFFSVSGWE